MMNENKEIRDILREILKWTKVTSIPNVKKLLLEILPSPEEKIAYQSSDGKTRKEVAKLANVSGFAISSWWKKWTKTGIADTVSVRGGGRRAIRSFSLEDFGIKIPELQKEKRSEEEKEHERR